MKVVLCTEFGEPETLVLEERPTPRPGPGEVRVALNAWGVSYVDLLMIRGGYQLRPELPFVPGIEAAGTVVELGEGVTGLRPGTRVMTQHRPGAFAEEVAIPASAAVPVPEPMGWAEAAGFRSAFTTAYHGLVQGARLSVGETVLIHGAAGGVGHAAVQVAKELGATVIATTGSATKRAALSDFGADHVIDIASGFRTVVKDLTQGRGVDVVFDPVGGAVFEESMRCLAWGARIVVVGFVGGPPALARTNHLLIKGASVVGIRVGEFARRHPEAAAANLRVLLEWASSGRIRTHVSHVVPFARVAEALRLVDARKVVGRVVLTRESG